ncbi:MAG: hypothetical protein ACREVN_01630 [Gammaproteobacteria bacterium]
MADEATKARVTREFFAAHSVADLAGKSGRRLNDQGRLTEPMWLSAGGVVASGVSRADIVSLERSIGDSPSW